MVPVALTIAGSDSGGGAGLQADILTFAAFGVHGTTVVTALTAQNTEGVRAVAPVAPEFVAEQLDAILDDFDVRAGKTGMLHRSAVIVAVAAQLRARRLPHLVVDPVLVSTSGASLLEASATAVLRAELLPLATLVTPNLREAEALLGRPVTDLAAMGAAARALVDLGARAALVTGGHLAGDAIDVLWDGHQLREFAAPRVETRHTHGTGCVLSAAITACLALGQDVPTAIETAKRHVTHALASAPGLGRGAGPVDLHLRARAG